jgi:hypothetical protein
MMREGRTTGTKRHRGSQKKVLKENTPPGVYPFELCELARGTPGDSLEPQNIEQGMSKDEVVRSQIHYL